MNKKDKAEAKKQLRVRRLMARLTLLNSDPPLAGTSEHRRKMWAQERANLLRQLKRHGITIE